MNSASKIFRTSLILILFFALISCKKDPAEEPAEDFVFDIWVLNEGLWNMNNASITGFHTTNGKIINDIYTHANNNRRLGDVANDIQLYGAKVYVAVSASSLIDVMDAQTGVSIKQIPLFKDSIASQPRQIACDNGKVYVCCFDGMVVKIDTAALQVETVAMAGRNPDGVCIANNKLYVSNSGGLDFPNYDNTVSVFDLNTFAEIRKITVRMNPAMMKVDPNGNLYLVSKGNYEDVHPCLQKINTVTDQIEQTFEMDVAGFDIFNNAIYFYTFNYSSSKAEYQIFDLLKDSITHVDFITDNIRPKTPYSLNINPANGDIYIADALDYTSIGDVYCFSKDGKKKFQFEAGMIPKKVLIK
jgi:DNA-binding beta-propeller fold protein YncE